MMLSLLLLLGATASGQSKAAIEQLPKAAVEQQTTGQCSPAVNGSNNTVSVTCSGLEKTIAANLISLLNNLLHSSNDDTIKGELQQMQVSLDDIHQNQVQTHGVLIPGSDPDPPTNCPTPTSRFRVYAGGSVFGWEGGMSFSVIRMSQQSLLSIRQQGDGILISAFVFGRDGKVVMKMVDNEWRVNPNNIFYAVPSANSLTVVDMYNRKVFDVRFVNKHAILVEGMFVGRSGTVTVTKDAIYAPGMRLTDSCNEDILEAGIDIGN